jgi:hypothetical protein
MEHADLLALYDQEQRIDIEWPGQRREMTEHVVRHINLAERADLYSYLVYSRLNSDNADAVIQQEMEYFRRLGHHMEWKLCSHDQPADLDHRLAAAGFSIEEPEAIMVLNLQALPTTLKKPVSSSVRRIMHPEQIAEMLSVQREVWGKNFEVLAAELAESLRERPDQLSIYAVYVDDLPVSSAWIRYTPRSQFASLWGGSTLSPYRGHGHYTALLTVRAQEAVRRGMCFLTVDASPMSRPILEKNGFRLITWARECNWTNQTSTGA